jgi:hypothetical protein
MDSNGPSGEVAKIQDVFSQLEASDHQLWTKFQTKIMLKAIAVKPTKLAWGLSKF